MKYGLKYHMEFINQERDENAVFSGALIEVDIYDLSAPMIADEETTVTNIMIASGDPLHISSINNDEDKYASPIKSIQAKIQFLSDQVNLQTFTNSPVLGDDPGDPRWYVEIKSNEFVFPINPIIFKGFLILDDCSEAFMPEPNVVTLVATDGLGLLKDIPLTDFDGVNPTGNFRIAQFIAWALRKTGLELDLYVVMNIRRVVYESISTSTSVQWVRIDADGGPYYFVYNPSSGGYYSVTPTPTPPPYPATLTADQLTYLASGPVNFASYINSHYTGWDQNINLTGDVATVSGTINEPASNDKHLYDDCLLNSKTFEDKIGTCVNCYQALEIILGEMAFLTQYGGRWWIIRPDELEENVDYTIGWFNPDGSWADFLFHQSVYFQNIGKDGYTIFFSQEATDVLQTSQHKFVKETYKFQFPLEIICNSDFARGDFISVLGTEVDPETGNNVTAMSYEVDCWDYRKSTRPITNDVAQDSEVYIKRIFNQNDTEIERYLHFAQTATDNFYYLVSEEKIPVSIKDKFNISLSVRYDSDLGGAKPYAVPQLWIRLYGDDGTYWSFGGSFGTGLSWKQTTSSWPAADFTSLNLTVETTTNLADWNSLNEESFPVPVGGELEIILLHATDSDAHSKDITSLSFEYIPYVAGSYRQYEGISSRSYRNINFRASRDKEVFISDGIRKLFKGAMLDENDALANEFFDWKRFNTPTLADVFTYLHIQTLDVWNQYRNVMNVFHATCQGLNSHTVNGINELNYPSLIHTYFLQDPHVSTFNRRFMMLNYDWDVYLCEWKGTLAEVFNIDRGKTFDDPLEVKYE